MAESTLPLSDPIERRRAGNLLTRLFGGGRTRDAAEPSRVRELEQEQEELADAIKAGSTALIIIAVAIVLGLFYVAKTFLITVFTSILIAFMLGPIVDGLTRLRMPRAVSSLIAVILMLAVLGTAVYFFYNRAVEFGHELPKYSQRIQGSLGKFRREAKKLNESTQTLMTPTAEEKKAVPVQVQRSPGLSGMVTEGSGIVGEIVLAASFVPFLVYFMLTWQEHVRRMGVRLFHLEHRESAHETLDKISAMAGAFIAGNLIVGLLMGIASAAVFWWLEIPYALFVGLISGFVSLVPYLGVLLALFPPLAGGIGQLSSTGIVLVIATVVLLHLFALNVFYPKILGKRLRLNPLAVTLGLLFWALIWGAMGLILAVPIMGTLKIICDHVEALQPLGAWLGD
jgi:predicted PurR-regulated permease PerM